MIKKVLHLCLIFVLMASFSLFLSACGKDSVKDEEPLTMQPQVSESEKAEAERAAREAQLREEALRSEREKKEAARREEEARMERKAKEEAQLRGEFEKVDIYFDFDKYVLTSSSRETLAKKASWLLDHPDAKVTIEGHCDERGTNEYNLALGEKRASSAKNYLVAAGVKTNRISTISYGEERPVDRGNNEAAWVKNRRAHFVLLSK